MAVGLSEPDAKRKSGARRCWSISTPTEKQFSGVDVQVSAGDFAVQGMARVVRADELEQKNKLVGAGMRQMTIMLDKMVPAVPMEPLAEEQVAEVEGLQTNGEAMLNLLNNCLGSGMLGMGYCVSQLGLVLGLLAMLASLFLNKYTLLLNLKLSTVAGCKPASTEVGA
eukprot:CAMPEP_0180658880 /NCGR_PEP_ID=MMETSP1037_2-20121125/57261_1 /TAXON_ID=632150 /ORGANISM="Azadinium spinosum, Strain 3D9" /LENGTH=167 /DNA_ID=CAMNT_0022685839 /DNA_START=26 /DNA_END=526 /DNA_ORIENTATION=+